MNVKLLLAIVLACAPAWASTEINSGCRCGHDLAAAGGPTELAAGKATEVAKRHPLRGVITAVHADRSALMVKHEEIPGVMRAMTMLFKVDPAVAKAAKKGQTVTAMMSREGDEWWLHDVKLSDAPAK